MDTFYNKEIEAVILKLDDGTRIEEKDEDIIAAWYGLNYASEKGTNRDCDDALYDLEKLYLEKHGENCTFDGEVIFKTTEK